MCVNRKIRIHRIAWAKKSCLRCKNLALFPSQCSLLKKNGVEFWHCLAKCIIKSHINLQYFCKTANLKFLLSKIINKISFHTFKTEILRVFTIYIFSTELLHFKNFWKKSSQQTVVFFEKGILWNFSTWIIFIYFSFFFHVIIRNFFLARDESKFIPTHDFSRLDNFSH